MKHAPLKKAGQLAFAAVLSALSLTAMAADTTQKVGAGQHYYQQICAKCHEAGVGPVIKGRGFPAMTYVVIARNGMNAMPAFRATDIDDATLLALGEYLAQTPVPAADAAKK